MGKERCKDCRFFVLGAIHLDVGACRRFPPTEQSSKGWPEVVMDEWCGEWKPFGPDLRKNVEPPTVENAADTFSEKAALLGFPPGVLEKAKRKSMERVTAELRAAGFGKPRWSEHESPYRHFRLRSKTGAAWIVAEIDGKVLAALSHENEWRPIEFRDADVAKAWCEGLELEVEA